ncbi:hypothetical protein [Pseudolactococcus laudensis]|uniref:hypothetical protein n=1 Tax=Pseudolactococcus laudensis TaxID=1494461 RepID=UPI002FC89A94
MLKFEEKFQHPNLVHLTVMLVLALTFLTSMVNFYRHGYMLVMFKSIPVTLFWLLSPVMIYLLIILMMKKFKRQ